jgi:DNA topoisomerase-1
MAKKKYLVIVESPAKCKTISKFLGPSYELTASYGHVRDLPSRTLGVDIENNFLPKYQNLKDKSKVIKTISDAAKKCDIVYIATDPDREGEAIAWHILHAAKLDSSKARRIVFNEITEKAIKAAIDEYRDIDINLVDAQQARRVLDRLIGYTLSPVLSRKIQKGLSAGRVQSVAVKIVVEREKEILAFKSVEYWTIESDLAATESNNFTSRLVAQNSLKEKLEVNNEADAMAIKEQLENASYSVDDVIKSRIKRNPVPAFITSTLQQESSRKLGWTAKRTMIVAQQLYEGQSINGESTGLITYMRTDSTRISDEAKANAISYISTKYGKNYLGVLNKEKKTNQKVQDAHEAIRPTDLTLDPESIQSQLSNEHYKLYKLIWNRFLASLMAPAEYDRTQVVIKAKAKKADYFLRASGSILVFDGFTRLYTEGLDDKKEDENKEALLPSLEKDQKLKLNQVLTEQKFTQPPPRYSEATLVKELEQLGIGRPSTYAPTLSTIEDRGYIEKIDKKLHPTELGTVVTEQLEQYFTSILDLAFTADMEKQLDDIQEGSHNWPELVKSYYDPLSEMIKSANTNMQKLSISERVLGVHPTTGKEVIAKIGRFGPMIQIGKSDDEDKPIFAGVDASQDIKTISLDEALALFKFPLTLGQFEDSDVLINRGKFGPYIKHNNVYTSIPKDTNLHSISLNEAIDMIQEKRLKDAQKNIHHFESKDGDILVLNGRFGPYISFKKKNFKIPKETDPRQLTLEQCLVIIKKKKK